MKVLLSLLLTVILGTSLSAVAFAETSWNKDFMEMYGIEVIDDYLISIGDVVWDVKKLARDNDVDPDELKAAILAGPDADGRLSPFANLKQLGNKSFEEQITDTDRHSVENKSFGKHYTAPKIGKHNLYVLAGKLVANGNRPYFMQIALLNLGIVAESVVNQTPITAREAASIGLSEAGKFIDNPLLFNVNSTDYRDTSRINPGFAGKRRAWNVFVGDKDGAKKMTFLIVDKRIEDFTYDAAANYDGGFRLTEGTFGLSDIIFDSNEVIDLVVREKGLRPGNPERAEDWLIGYHYAIEDVVIPDALETRLVIEVYGISPSGNLANVVIDQKNGKIISSSEKVSEDQNGRSIWEAF